MEEKNYLTIGEAAKMIGVTPLTLRNWDKKGKLEAARNPINNYRMYKKEKIKKFIKKMEEGKNKKQSKPKKVFLG